MISAAKKDIIKAYYPGYFMQAVEGQVQTKQIQASHDDSYQGIWCSISFGLILISAVKVHPVLYVFQVTLLLLGNLVVIRWKVHQANTHT